LLGVGRAILVTRSYQVIWALLSLELLNLAILNMVMLSQAGRILLFVLRVQVIERVILITLVFINIPQEKNL